MVISARLAAGLLALLLTACATTPPIALPSLAAIPAAFEMSGRLAVRQGQNSEIAKLRWIHRASSDVWVFASPLGNEVARIESGAAGATLLQAGAATQSATSFAELTGRVLGVPLDPATLAGWLHGATAAPAAGEWQVTIEETQEGGGAVAIARRISATRGEVSVRLVVDEYRVIGR